jgi:CBS domain containing-hemolysin-like protein
MKPTHDSSINGGYASLEDGQRRRPGFLEILSRFLTGRKKITEEEIQEMMAAGEEEGLINEEENAMIQSILQFRDTVVREIMVPRTEIACISSDAAVSDIIREIIACGHSRMPVYEDSIDNIIGLVYAKDLLKYWGMDASSIELKKIIRVPYFVPESKNLEELLQEFKRKRMHIAIVIDEYGGTSGLVTIEDVLEQIVGDIQDEYDLEEEWISCEPDGSFVVDGRLPVEELEDHVGIQVEREKFDTVSGLIYHLTGRIPKTGEEIDGGPIRLLIIEADERKIKKVRVDRKIESSGETEE